MSIFLTGQTLCRSAIVFAVLSILSAHGAGVNPSIVIQPADAWVQIGKVASFQIQASGTDPKTYVWLKGGRPIPGSDAPDYAVMVADSSLDGAVFRCVVANDSGVDSSRNAVLHVVRTVQAPRFTAALDSSPVALGDTAWFRAQVTGMRPYVFAWYKNGIQIPSAGDSTLAYGPVVPADSATDIKCRVANAGGSAETHPVRLKPVQPGSRTLLIQGYLSDPDGNAIGGNSDDTLDMVVSLYAQPKGGAPIYAEGFLKSEGRGVIVERGAFQAQLGGRAGLLGLPAAIAGSKQLFVGFSIGRDGATPEALEPRTPFTSAPFALRVGP